MEDGQASSHPITVWEANDMETKTKSAESPKTSENVEDF